VGTALLLMVGDSSGSAAAAEAVSASWKSVLRLRESGKVCPLWIVGESQLDRMGGVLCRPDPQVHRNGLVASILDSFLKGLEVGLLQGTLPRSAVERVLQSDGFGSFGVGQGSATPEGLKQALEGSLGQGWMGTGSPPSRGHEAIFLVGIGSEVLGRSSEELARLAPLVKGASGMLPQARTVTSWVGFRGEGVRVLTYVGGLALPERLGLNRQS
jgi:hypothetical protein